MANRLNLDDKQALMRIRENLILDYNALIEPHAEPATAMTKQVDVARAIERAVKSLEEVLSTAGGITFE